ncbi:MAG: hypothetical protein WCO84_01870 [bacterium]
MEYFDKDFWKYTAQFFLVILVTLISIGIISGYITGSGGTEANLVQQQ